MNTTIFSPSSKEFLDLSRQLHLYKTLCVIVVKQLGRVLESEHLIRARDFLSEVLKADQPKISAIQELSELTANRELWRQGYSRYARGLFTFDYFNEKIPTLNALLSNA